MGHSKLNQTVNQETQSQGGGTGKKGQEPSIFRGKLFRVGLLVLLAFSLSEGALRFRAQQRFGEANATYSQAHPVLGSTLKPNFKRTGSLGTLSINEHGFRGRSFSAKPEMGVSRVVCLGDSVVFGGGGMMSDDETFPAVTQTILNAQGLGRKYEVLNAGVPGWTSTKILWNLESRVYDFAPEIVVIYPSANDITAAMRAENIPKAKAVSVSLNPPVSG